MPPKEAFLPGHKFLPDSALLALPAAGPLTPPHLFVCTYVATVGNLHMPFQELTRRMCERPHGCLLAVNSNFGHAAQPGYEHLIKHPKPPKESTRPSRGRTRKVQGDGTCFNSAVEPVISIQGRLTGLPNGKLYNLKVFSTTGEIQVPGVIRPDIADGPEVLRALIDYLNELGAGDAEPPVPDADASADADVSVPPARRQIYIVKEGANMINHKFAVIRHSPDILVNLFALADYIKLLETLRAVEGQPLTQPERFEGWPAIVLPPYPIRETKPPTDDVKAAFVFLTENGRKPRINIFQEGKINILGGSSAESSAKIYAFFVEFFTRNWSSLIALKPRRDVDSRRVAPEPPAPPALKLTDADIDELLADIFEAPRPRYVGFDD